MEKRSSEGRRLVIITGPTASGKSALAVDAARQLHTEIISADSRQVYRGIPVSTAVPPIEERGGIRHHLLEFLPLDAYYSAALFERDALAAAESIWASGKRDVIVCGGSMMYVDALCHGIDELPTVSAEVRDRLACAWAREGDDWLRTELRRLDPVHYARVDLCNMKRVFHAVEISLQAGVPYSTLTTGRRKRRDFETVKICLDLPRETLFGRINRRVEAMARGGLLDEARRVWPMRHLNSLNTVGLKEMFKVVEGEWCLDFALARMAKNTRVYAKKQLTWYRRDPEVVWLAPEDVMGYLAH